MFPLLLFLVSQVVPTGHPGLPRAEVARSPLEAEPPSFGTVSTLSGGRGDRVLVVVADYLVEPLSFQLARFASDIAADGWTVEVTAMGGGTAEDLKTLLQGVPGLDGAILVGFLPCAWYEEDYWAVEEFPCELFLADLDGTWQDQDADGFYDGHTGSVSPEIWLGRIDASAMSYASEVSVLASYFDKNHLYRTGTMPMNSRALSFVDDDWSSSYSDCGLGAIYGSAGVTVSNSPAATTAESYLNGLGDGYEFVHLMSHSSPWGHTFLVPGGYGGSVMAPEISAADPQTAFYQLFSCSNARWVESGCLGNWYLFGTSYGLLVCGAAKTGSMLDFEQFYTPLGNGDSFGEAFRAWWQYQAQGGFSGYEKAWFYGNTLLGDPTLRPLNGTGSFAGLASPQGCSSYDRVSTSEYSDCHPAAAEGPGNMSVVAWLTGENGRLDVAARLIDGDSWSQVYYVDPDEYWDAGVAACFDGNGTPWLAWSDFEYETYSYRIKTAHGNAFENVEIRVPQDGYQVFPQLAWDGERMWLAWLNWEATGGEVMVTALDGSFPAQAVSSPGTFCAPPAMTSDGGSVSIAWVEQSPAGSRIMASVSSGGAFSTPSQMSSGTVCHSPFLVTVDGQTLLVWQDDTSGSSIMARLLPGNEFEVASPEGHAFRPSAGRFGEDQFAVYWQEGFGQSAAIMGSIVPGGDPIGIVSPEGPAWFPAAGGERLFWAGNPGEGWNIYTAFPEWTGVGQSQGPSPTPQVSRNPVHGSLMLAMPEGGGSFTGGVDVFDLAGRLVVSRNITIAPGENLSVDCGTLPSGIYMLVTTDGVSCGKFTVIRD